MLERGDALSVESLHLSTVPAQSPVELESTGAQELHNKIKLSKILSKKKRRRSIHYKTIYGKTF